MNRKKTISILCVAIIILLCGCVIMSIITGFQDGFSSAVLVKIIRDVAMIGVFAFWRKKNQEEKQ